MARALAAVAVAALALVAPAAVDHPAAVQRRSPADLTGDLSSPDAAVRARAACELKEHGDESARALKPLVELLADGAPVDASVCARRWWSSTPDNVTTPGQLAAAALVALGSPAFDPLLAALRHPAWIARRNAAWALGALDDSRAAPALIAALGDSEPAVREQAAWALGALDDRAAVAALIPVLQDGDARVRRQAAWALGVIGDSRALAALLAGLKDPEASVRRQVAWAIGVIGR